MTTLAGVISDTHGLLRPEAATALAGCDLIIHAGDIGKPEVLEALRSIAPVTAIRGNVDRWAQSLPDSESVEVEGRRLYVLHDLKTLGFDPRAAGFDVVIAGHSHRPDVHERDGVLYLNPGSAGPRRFRLPVAVARLAVSATAVRPTLIELAIAERPSVRSRRRHA